MAGAPTNPPHYRDVLCDNGDTYAANGTDPVAAPFTGPSSDIIALFYSNTTCERWECGWHQLAGRAARFLRVPDCILSCGRGTHMHFIWSCL